MTEQCSIKNFTVSKQGGVIVEGVDVYRLGPAVFMLSVDCHTKYTNAYVSKQNSIGPGVDLWRIHLFNNGADYTHIDFDLADTETGRPEDWRTISCETSRYTTLVIIARSPFANRVHRFENKSLVELVGDLDQESS